MGILGELKEKYQSKKDSSSEDDMSREEAEEAYVEAKMEEFMDKVGEAQAKRFKRDPVEYMKENNPERSYTPQEIAEEITAGDAVESMLWSDYSFEFTDHDYENHAETVLSRITPDSIYRRKKGMEREKKLNSSLKKDRAMKDKAEEEWKEMDWREKLEYAILNESDSIERKLRNSDEVKMVEEDGETRYFLKDEVADQIETKDDGLTDKSEKRKEIE
jgi:hypothetical protein